MVCSKCFDFNESVNVRGSLAFNIDNKQVSSKQLSIYLLHRCPSVI